jgi:hypothetical protein
MGGFNIDYGEELVAAPCTREFNYEGVDDDDLEVFTRENTFTSRGWQLGATLLGDFGVEADIERWKEADRAEQYLQKRGTYIQQEVRRINDELRKLELEGAVTLQKKQAAGNRLRAAKVRSRIVEKTGVNPDTVMSAREEFDWVAALTTLPPSPTLEPVPLTQGTIGPAARICGGASKEVDR